MPPTWYSRDETAVVGGAMTRWVSSFADTVWVHPSGALVVAGGDESTLPSSTGVAASAATASVSGSADAGGAADAHTNTQTTSAATGRTSTAQPSSAEARSALDHYLAAELRARKAGR